MGGIRVTFTDGSVIEYTDIFWHLSEGGVLSMKTTGKPERSDSISSRFEDWDWHMSPNHWSVITPIP